MKRNLIIEFICCLLILLFVYTAGSKLMHWRTSYHEMNNQPFPNWMTPFLVWGISAVEFSIAGLLIFEKTKKGGLLGSLALLALFTAYIASILSGFFKRIPCSCGGVIKQLSWSNHLLFNLFFIAISVLALILIRKKRRSEHSEETEHGILI